VTRDEKLMSEPSHGPWYYEQVDLGFNYRITDLQAALGLSQLKRVDDFVLKRRELVMKYNKAFEEAPVKRPTETSDNYSAYHLYLVGLESHAGARRQIFEYMKENNIGVNVHYIPVYWHPYYRERGYAKGLCPAAEDAYERLLSLPIFPEMTLSDVEDVLAAVDKVIAAYRR
jgi:dTDP-4-amino-4,6-dideoxygalactose transaminase